MGEKTPAPLCDFYCIGEHMVPTVDDCGGL